MTIALKALPVLTVTLLLFRYAYATFGKFGRAASEAVIAQINY